SPERSSDRNGSRPPPSYEKTSRTSTGVATLSRLALSGFAAAAGAGAGARFACAASPARGNGASGPVASTATTHAANRALTVRPPARTLLGRRWGRRRRLHEGADGELRLEQRAERVGQQLLRLARGRLEHHVLRDDDARQARDVGQELAQLVVMPDDLEAVAVGVERRSRLDRLGLDPADRHAAHFGLGRDVVDQ